MRVSFHEVHLNGDCPARFCFSVSKFAVYAELLSVFPDKARRNSLHPTEKEVRNAVSQMQQMQAMKTSTEAERRYGNLPRLWGTTFSLSSRRTPRHLHLQRPLWSEFKTWQYKRKDNGQLGRSVHVGGGEGQMKLGRRGFSFIWRCLLCVRLLEVKLTFSFVSTEFVRH